ncbi:MAG: glycosyltransferase, partial [Planctomycetota bacterium]
DNELDETVAFGFACTELLAALARHCPGPVISHHHEWMAGVAVPRLAHLQHADPDKFGGNLIASVFTTHATLLGRYLANDVEDLYDTLEHIDPDAAATHYNIATRYRLERAAAHGSTVFSTVSEITGQEARSLLGRRPDVILPNGLDIQRFEAPHEFQFLHEKCKEDIHSFVMGHFFPAGSFDLDKTIYLFTSGRYEYRNKGMDLFLEGLWRLNDRLKRQREANPDAEIPTVVAFIVTKADVKNINVETLKNQALTDDLRSYCEKLTEEMGRNLFRAATAGRMVHRGELITDDAEIQLKRAINARTISRHPSVVTHDLVDDANDPVLQHLRHRNLLNHPDDPVKVVFHPQFMTSTSPLLGMDYEHFVRGCHVGVFPSSYEPWGYTPMECIASGLPAVTTDLSGFGSYALATSEPERDDGVYVLRRRNTPFDDSAEALADFLQHFTRLGRRARIELRNRVEAMSGRYSWESVVHHYHAAHELVLQRALAGNVEVEAV